MRGKYTSLDRIFSKVVRDIPIPIENIGNSDVIEWSGEALEAIGSSTNYQPAVALLTVTGHQCEIPSFLHAVVQIARNNQYDEYGEATFSSVDTETTTVEGPDIPVALDENGTPINAYSLAYYRPYYDMWGEFFIGGAFIIGQYKFTPVRLADHTFFDTVVCNQEGYDGLYASCEDEYTVVGNMLRFSFETGQVAVSYLKQVTDPKTGYPMVPDTYSVTTAITKYITYKLMEREFYKGRQGSEVRLAKAEQDWHWYCKQAKNEDMMPQTIDEYENLLHQRNYLVPQTTKYYGFFGRLSHMEDRRLIYNRRTIYNGTTYE